MILGQHLYTKDGRKIGNAILTCIYQRDLPGVEAYEIETDFGRGGFIFNDAEIEELFFVEKEGRVVVSDIERWREDKRRLMLLSGPDFDCVKNPNCAPGDLIKDVAPDPAHGPTITLRSASGSEDQITKEEFLGLSSSGMLWEIYPAAPQGWPS